MNILKNIHDVYVQPQMVEYDIAIEAGFAATGDPGEAGGSLDYDEPSNF